MKKLSIEEKAKRYDEALKVIKECILDENGFITIYPQEIFPELKESEDERIRKALIKYFTLSDDNADYQCCGVHYKDIVAWLEKQDKKKLDDTNNRFIRMREIKPKDISEFLNRLTTVEQEFLWQYIEKVKKVDREEREQKPADKVEPKFHEGDWVFIEEVKGYKNGPFQIKTVDSFGYSFDEYHTILFMYEDILSKWSTKDANDGDVLYLQKDGKEHIIIYKGVLKERFRTFVSAYCAYNGIVDAFCFADVSRYVDIAYGGIIPATKEQRNTLMKAMADAGYTFDFEKKELKKIEQKSVVPKFRVGDTVRAKTMNDFVFTIKDITDKQYVDNNDGKFDIEGQDYLELVEQKSAWSEEDEAKLKSILFHIEDVENKDVIDWLKSLRPQNTWKPSDEQMASITYAVRNMKESACYDSELVSLLNDLKKLKGEQL